MTNREFMNIIINGNGTVTDKNTDGTKAGTRTIDLMADGVINAEIVEFAKEAIVKLDNKNANRKDSKAKIAKNEEDTKTMAVILNIMEGGTTYSSAMITELIKSEYPEIKQAKVTALLKKMVDNEMITSVAGFKPAKGKSKCTGYTK